jgi:enoyl-CoA hydratase
MGGDDTPGVCRDRPRRKGSDRASVLDQEGLDEPGALASEFTHGQAALREETGAGAARFAAGAGRHGSFRS